MSSNASPTQPSLIRARMTGPASALLRLRMRAWLHRLRAAGLRLHMRHVMENGQRRDAAGRPIPAWHIREFTLTLNGQPLLAGQFGGGISKDPFLELTLKGVKAGDRLQLDWTDTQGAQRSDRSEIQAS